MDQKETVQTEIVCKVVADYPKVEQVLRLPPSTTLRDLRTLFLQKGSNANYENYRTLIVNFGQDVKEITDEEKTPLTEFGLQTGSSVFLLAPPEIKPIREFKKAKKKSDQGEVDEKFKDFTPENACKLLLKSKTKTQKMIALEYIDLHAKDVLKSQSFLTLTQNSLKDVLSRDSLDLDEDDILESLLVWAGSQDSTPPLKELIKVIRIGFLSAKAVGEKLAPAKLLSEHQMLDLYAHISSMSSSSSSSSIVIKPLPASLKEFNNKPRKPAVFEVVFSDAGDKEYGYDYPRGFIFCANKPNTKLHGAVVRVCQKPAPLNVPVSQYATVGPNEGKVWLYQFPDKSYTNGAATVVACTQKFTVQNTNRQWYKCEFEKPIALDNNKMYAMLFELGTNCNFVYSTLPDNGYTRPVKDNLFSIFSRYSSSVNPKGVNIADNFYHADMKAVISL